MKYKDSSLSHNAEYSCKADCKGLAQEYSHRSPTLYSELIVFRDMTKQWPVRC